MDRRDPMDLSVDDLVGWWQAQIAWTPSAPTRGGHGWVWPPLPTPAAPLSVPRPHQDGQRG